MADSTVVQEFLAELGFKVDQKTLGDFTKALKSNATQAVAFGKTWSDLAEGVSKDAAKMVKGVFALTQQLDQLYFASRRLQDTAQNVAAMSYVYKQMGLAPEKGQAFGESLQEKQDAFGKVQFARWANQMVPGAGVTPQDTPEIAQRKMMHALALGAQSKDPRVRQATLARLQGIGGGVSWADLKQWDPSKDQQFFDQNLKNQKDFGANLDQTTKSAHDTATSLREIDDEMQQLSWGMMGAFLPAMKAGAAVGAQLGTALSGVARGIEAVASAWANATAKGVPQNVIPLSVGAGIGAKIASAAAGFAGWGGFSGFGGAAGGGAAPPPPTHHGAGVGSPPPQPPPSGPPISGGGRPTPMSGPEPTGSAPRAIRDFNPGNIMGTDPHTHRAIYNHYRSMAEGFAAMAWQLRYNYNKHGLHTIRQLILRWNPPHAAGNNPQETENYIHRVSSALGVDPNAQVDYTQDAVLRKLMLAIVNVEAGPKVNKYGALISQGLAAMPSVGTQVNNFNIKATEPKATGREVAAVMRHSATARHTRGGALT
jgi:hypothetical protein